jgi:hypothetical protein
MNAALADLSRALAGSAEIILGFNGPSLVRLAQQWSDSLGTDTIRITNASIAVPENTEFLTVTGSADLLGVPAQITVSFYPSPDMLPTTAISIA